MALLYPTYMELIEKMNEAGKLEGEDTVKSRYPVVLAAAKRARQIVEEMDHEEQDPRVKPLSIAVNELFEGSVTVTKNEE